MMLEIGLVGCTSCFHYNNGLCTINDRRDKIHQKDRRKFRQTLVGFII